MSFCLKVEIVIKKHCFVCVLVIMGLKKMYFDFVIFHISVVHLRTFFHEYHSKDNRFVIINKNH